MILETNGNYPSAGGEPVLPGQAYTIAALGEFDGATLTVQAEIDGAFRALPGVAFTSADAKVVDLPATTRLRAVVTDAGGSTEISYTVTQFLRG